MVGNGLAKNVLREKGNILDGHYVLVRPASGAWIDGFNEG